MKAAFSAQIPLLLDPPMTYHEQVVAAPKRRNDLNCKLQSVREELRTLHTAGREHEESSANCLEINARTCTGRFRDTAVVLYVKKTMRA